MSNSLLKFCLSGEISPNLVTLIEIYLGWSMSSLVGGDEQQNREGGAAKQNLDVSPCVVYIFYSVVNTTVNHLGLILMFISSRARWEGRCKALQIHC